MASVRLIRVREDGVLDSDCYTTTNRKTTISHKGRQIPVSNIRMDCFIVVKDGTARCVELRNLKKGDMVVTTEHGVDVAAYQVEEKHEFGFMSSDISSERGNLRTIKKIARMMHRLKKQGKKIAIVVGPAVVHTGIRESLTWLIENGYISLFLGGNAVAVHDIEMGIFGTSLGNGVDTRVFSHSHHIWAINRVNREGSIRKAVENGVITDGIMYSLVKNDVPFMLAGSYRDDGPLVDVIIDMNEAQNTTRQALQGVDMVMMLSTMLHSIAVGNMIAADVTTICVDINPATVTKLSDRGSSQAMGIVTDVSLFVKILADELESFKK